VKLPLRHFLKALPVANRLASFSFPDNFYQHALAAVAVEFAMDCHGKSIPRMQLNHCQALEQ